MNKRKRKEKRERTKAWKRSSKSPEGLLKYGAHVTFVSKLSGVVDVRGDKFEQAISTLTKNVNALNNEVAQIKVAIEILKRQAK